jgi:anti-anti-sigma factor
MDAAQCLTLAASRREDEVVITIRGDLDFGAVDEMTSCIESAVDERVKLCILDCQQVTFADSEALKALLMLQCRFARVGRELCIRKCSRQLFRLLTLLGIREQLGCPG